MRRYRLESAPERPSASRLDLDRALNSAQRAAVESDATRILILAGAGTGKTRTLTHRVARLIEKGVAPHRILLATFTNRAAREMIERIEVILGPAARRVRAGTFHSLAYRTLRRHGAHLGFDPSFGILVRDDQKEVMAASIADAGVQPAARRFPSAEVLVDLLSLSINTDRTLSETLVATRLHLAPLEPEIERVLSIYAKKKVGMNVMDFDDLLLFWKALLVERPELSARLEAEVEHVLVDEYQDTNRLQAEIAARLAGDRGHLCVVGDDGQSIYAFRGARFDNILEFPTQAETAVFRLTENYRSSRQILALANQVIAQNRTQFPKDLTSDHDGPLLPAIIPARDSFQQAEFVAQRVLELRDEGVPLTDQAVLYRTHGQSVELQLELTKRDIPYVVRSGRRFFEQAHVRDLVAFLRAVHNPKEELAWRRILGILPGVGNRSSGRIYAAIAEAVAARRDHLDAALEAANALASRARKSVTGLVEVLRSAAQQEQDPGMLIRTILDGPLADHLAAVHANAARRTEELEQLADIAAQSKDLGAFLTEIALVNEIAGEEMTSATQGSEREYLTLSTVHQAKGLEWKAVFVAGLTDGGFPHQTALEEEGGEAEERRLFYVAVTRAKAQLYLTYPGSRIVRDQDRILTRPSRFLAELTEGLAEKWVLDEG